MTRTETTETTENSGVDLRVIGGSALRQLRQLVRRLGMQSSHLSAQSSQSSHQSSQRKTAGQIQCSQSSQSFPFT